MIHKHVDEMDGQWTLNRERERERDKKKKRGRGRKQQSSFDRYQNADDARRL